MFRFTIRDVLWLTVVVGLGIMWWGEYRQRMLDSSDLRAEYRRLEQERNSLLSARDARNSLESTDAFRQFLKKVLEERTARDETPPPPIQKATPAEN